MKILFVAMAESIHTARWISQLYDCGHELHLFPAIANRSLHPLLNGKVSFYPYPLFSLPTYPSVFTPIVDCTNRIILHTRSSKHQERSLANLINRIQPDLIHSLEFQSAGYLTLRVKKISTQPFPQWLATNWGSDIYYFGKSEKHGKIISDLLAECNYYSCECSRDINLAHRYGFKGKTYLSTTNTGGYNLTWTKNNQVKNPLKRNIIMLKGYENWSGRALTALSAFEKVPSSLLNDYELVIYSINPPNDLLVQKAMALTTLRRMKLTVVPLNTNHETILRLHGKARISIGLSISDALSTSAIEALVMGSYPIQSNTACLSKYVKNGINGYLVPVDKVKLITKCITEALLNDDLITKSFLYNQKAIAPLFDYGKVKQESLRMYSDIYSLQ